MGSFVYMIARDDADIIEEKRPEFEERLEKVFNAAGMMEQEHLTLFGKGIRALRPVRIENGYTTFFYNYFEDDVWENAGYYNKNGGVYRYHILWRIFHDMIHDPDMLKESSVIFDKESLANGEKKLRYSWKMTDTNLKRNKARMTVKRYLSLISNKELRRKVFGF